MSIQDTLQERGNRYGDFTDHAKIAQDLQAVMQGATTVRVPFEEGGVTPWSLLSPVQRQALTVIADKIARILSGDPNYADNWHDIQGYAKLVEERLLVPADTVTPSNDNLPDGFLPFNVATDRVPKVDVSAVILRKGLVISAESVTHFEFGRMLDDPEREIVGYKPHG